MGTPDHPVRRAWPYFVRFLAIGTFVAAIDIGSLDGLLALGVYLPIATTISYGLAVSVHFTLNKYANFRSFSRPAFAQMQTYGAVAVFQWLIVLAIVEVGVHFGFRADVSKAIAIVVNIPVGFFGHRHLTFGPGILAVIRRYLPSSPR